MSDSTRIFSWLTSCTTPSVIAIVERSQMSCTSWRGRGVMAVRVLHLSSMVALTFESHVKVPVSGPYEYFVFFEAAALWNGVVDTATDPVVGAAIDNYWNNFIFRCRGRGSDEVYNILLQDLPQNGHVCETLMEFPYSVNLLSFVAFLFPSSPRCHVPQFWSVELPSRRFSTVRLANPIQMELGIWDFLALHQGYPPGIGAWCYGYWGLSP